MSLFVVMRDGILDVVAAGCRAVATMPVIVAPPLVGTLLVAEVVMVMVVVAMVMVLLRGRHRGRGGEPESSRARWGAANASGGRPGGGLHGLDLGLHQGREYGLEASHLHPAGCILRRNRLVRDIGARRHHRHNMGTCGPHVT